jgi:hypothetical protein
MTLAVPCRSRPNCLFRPPCWQVAAPLCHIQAEKLRHSNAEAAEALARPGRYHSVAGNLRLKEVWAGGDGVRAERFVVCHNPDQAERDRAVRDASSLTSPNSSTAPTPGWPACATSSSGP